jgi:hypothetical protein
MWKRCNSTIGQLTKHVNNTINHNNNNNNTISSELMREFIQDSLYNVDYGYFSRNVNIFECKRSLPFTKFRDQDDYYRALRGLYAEASIAEPCANLSSSFRQLWHTPSELFKPFYGAAVVNYLIANLTRQSEPLIIYEIGPGNGTLAENILDTLREEHREIYTHVEYHVVEISAKLRSKQAERLKPRHGAHVHFHSSNLLLSGCSIPVEPRPCTIIAMEVLDNLPHDQIKFSNTDGTLMEALVYSNPQATYGSTPGKYWREFQTARDPLVLEYAALAERMQWSWPSLTGRPLNRLFENLGVFDYINPWSCEFIPTGALQMLKSLVKLFPRHSLLCSDFHVLPDTIPGHSSPVVQTRYKGVTVPCSSVLLERGLFDIFFPTDFARLAQIHKLLRPGNGNLNQKIQKHAAFLKTWAHPHHLRETCTKSSYNPMLQDFENVSFYTCEYNN